MELIIIFLPIIICGLLGVKFANILKVKMPWRAVVAGLMASLLSALISYLKG